MANPPDLLIVPARDADARALAALHADAHGEPWSEADFRRLAGASAAVVLMASGGPLAQPAGFVLAFAAADEAEILMLAVRAAMRRRGIGRALIEALEQELAGRGIARLHLEVAAGNGAAIALYRRLGFKATGSRRGYYERKGQAAEDALLMAKELG
jgi:ribosomal-protein-alanine N-acetyltransferase